jgi:hypothetical protein
MKTVAVVAAAPYGQFISDLTAIGALAGKPEIGQMIEGGFTFFTQGKGPNAIDKTKPWGLIVQTDGAGFLPVVCIPVVKPDDLIEVATNFGAEKKAAGGGVQELAFANGKSIYVKVENGWAFVAQSSGTLEQLPEDPQSILAKQAAGYLLTVHVSVKDVPEMYRQFAIQAMQAGMQQQLVKKDDESDEQFESRQQMAQAQIEQVERMINEFDSLTIGWAADATAQRTYLDFSYVFRPDSKMAQQIAAYGKPQTNFAGFYQPDAAGTVTFATQSDPKLIAEDLAKMEQMYNSAREQINRKIDTSDKVTDDEARAALKSAVSDFFDALVATIKTGQMDGGGALQLSADSLTVVAAAHVADTAKVESALKQVETAAKKSPDFPGIKWNAAKHGGVTFHTMKVPVPEDKKSPRQLLGSELDVAIGIGPQAVYLAAGKDNIQAVSQAIDASAKEAGKAVPPFELAIALRPIAEAMAASAEGEREAAIAKSIADMLANEAQGRDHIRAVGQFIPNGLKYHIEAEEGVLRAMGAAAAEVQRQKLQAQQ